MKKPAATWTTRFAGISGDPCPLRLAIDDESTAPPPDLQPTSSRPASSEHDEATAPDMHPDAPKNEEAGTQEAITNLMAAFPDSELVTFDPPAASSQQG